MNAFLPGIRVDLLRPRLRRREGGRVEGVATRKKAETTGPKDAKAAEQSWLASLPKEVRDSIPAASDRVNRADAQLKAKEEQADGSGAIAKSADRRRQNEKELATMARRSQHRDPHKPVGLTETRFVDDGACWRLPIGEEPNNRVIVGTARDLDFVTTGDEGLLTYYVPIRGELEQQMETLSRVFDLARYPGISGLKSVPAVVKRAAQAAADALRDAWIPELIEAMTRAKVAELQLRQWNETGEGVGNEDRDRVRDEANPAHVAREVLHRVKPYGSLCEVPPWLAVTIEEVQGNPWPRCRVVEALLGAFNPGRQGPDGKVKGAGGRTGKLTQDGMTKLLGNPKELAKVLRKAGKPDLADLVRNSTPKVD